TKSLILSMHENHDYIMRAVEVGALGYLLKDSSKEEILTALRSVAKGEKYFNNPVSNIIVEGYLNRIKQSSFDFNPKIKLSKKEKVILRQIVEGQNSREIAEKFDLSIRTVDNHRANMMKKLSVKNAAELVKLAIENKLY
ncbi:MAG TPA: response regulator transcription factor, partial [Cytophagaceae bacterium]